MERQIESLQQRSRSVTANQSRQQAQLAETLRQHYQDGIAYSLQAKLIRKDVKVDDLLDDRFVEQGLKNLNLTSEWK